LIEQSLYFFYEFKEGTSPKILTAIFNSKLFQFIYWTWMITNRDATPQLKKIHLDRFPIRPIDLTSQSDVALHEKMISLVDSMLSLHAKQAMEKNPMILRQIATEIKSTDKRIGNIVYQIYGLSEEEIALVEGSTGKIPTNMDVDGVSVDGGSPG
jgi:hypothetical protein